MKNRIMTTIIAITIIMTTLFMLASVNTSALTVVEETPPPTATVESTPVPMPPADYQVEFTIVQEHIYLEKTTITGTIKDGTRAYKFQVSVNGVEYETIIIPKSEDGKFSMELDFSDCSVGDEVTFIGTLAEEFSFPCIESFHLERRLPTKAPKKSKVIRLNKKKVTLKVGKKVKLKLKGAKKSKVKWSCNKKKIARVRKGIVKAKKPGKCKVVAKYLGKKYKCVVNVIKRNKKDKSVVNEKEIGLQLEWKDDNYKTAVLKIVNNSNQEIMTGYAGIVLRKFTAGKWEDIAILDTAPPVPALAVIIKPKKEWSETISINEDFGDLSSGDYILSKRVHANGKELFPSVKFTVSATMPATTATPTSTPVATPIPDITTTQYPKDDFMPGEVLVGMKEDMTADEVIKLFSGLEIESVSAMSNFANDPEFKGKGFCVILKEKTKSSVAPAIEIIKQNALVEYAEPNYLAYLA